MARSPTGTLGTHFLEENTTLARLLTINRLDGTVIRLTDHDADIDVLPRAIAAVGALTLDDVSGGEAKATAILNITSGNNALDTETVTIGARVYTFEAAFTDTADSVLIGVDRSATLLNLTNAVNNDGPTEGVTYGTGTVIHTDVTATAPTQSSISGVQIIQAEGTVVGNMDTVGVFFTSTNEQSFDGNINVSGNRTSVRPAPTGHAYVGKDFSVTPQRINSATVFGSNSEGWWNPSGTLSTEMTIELRGKVGAAPADDAAYLVEGTILGTAGPFINPMATGTILSPPPSKVITSSDNTTEFDHVWITITEPNTTRGGYVSAEVQFFNVVVHAGAGDMGLEAKIANDEGNLIALAEGLTNGAWTPASFMSGGADAVQNINDGETVTIGTKVYTFEDTLTDVDGNVQIGTDANESLSNLDKAIDLDGTGGVEYAASMTEHPDVTSTVDANVLTATAEVAGSAGNSIDTTETLTNGSWAEATLLGGEDALYLSVPGFTASASLSSSVEGIEGVEITTIEGHDAIVQNDILTGRYAEAQCSLEYVNWASVGDGFMILFTGVMGDINNDEDSNLSFEIQGKFSRNRLMRINTYQPSCRADLGDAACKFDINQDRKTFTISTVVSPSTFQTTELTDDDDFWKLGVLHFLTGSNTGVAVEISSSTSLNGEVTMFLPAPLVMQIGDTGEIWPGCDKTINTCIQRFDNVINFRGEPFAPQEKALFAFKE